MYLILKYLKYLAYTSLFLVSLLGLILASLPYVVDLTEFKNKVLAEIESKIELNIEYIDANLVVFPVPGIEFNYLRVYDDELVVLDVNHLKLYFSILRLLNGDIEVVNCQISDGKIFLERNSTGRFEIFDPFFALEPSENQNIQIKPSFILPRIPDSTKVENVHLYLNDSFYKKSYHLYLWKSGLRVNEDEKIIELDLYGKLNDRKIEIYKEVSFHEDEFSYESLRFKGTILLDKFNLSLLDDILIIFPYAKFSDAIASGRIFILKEDSDLSIADIKSLNLKNFSYKNGSPFGDATISTKITYSYEKHRLGFEDIDAEWKNRIKTRGNGYLTFTDRPIIQFYADADYLDTDSLTKIVGLWLDADLDKSIFFRGMPDTGYVWKYNLILDIQSNNVKYDSFFMPSVKTRISYRYPVINIESFETRIYEGLIQSKGSIDISASKPSIDLNGRIEDFSSSKLLSKVTESKYLTGTLQGDFQLKTMGVTEKEILSNIQCRGNFSLREGELIGYLNILRPVANVGKIINLSGPPGDSMAYESIEGKFSYRNGVFSFPEMKMKGVGLDALGNGKISLNGEIDYRLTLSLSGLAGRAIKLPIIYKGIFGRSLPYVDPVWLGTVYAGTIFLAGPAGAAVGGIAGSAASDYVNRFIGTMRNYFNKDAEEK